MPLNHEATPRHRLEGRAKLPHLKPRNIIASMAVLGSAVSLHGDSIERHELPTFAVTIPSHTPEIETDPSRRISGVLLPDDAQKQGEKSYPNHPVSQESKKGKHNYCQVVDMDLPRYFDRQEVERGARTEFALSTEAFMEARYQLDRAESIEEVQHVMTEVLGSLGITAKYGEIESSMQRQQDGKMVEQFTDRAYAEGMVAHLEALTLLPRELVMMTKNIYFAGSDRLPDDRLRSEKWTVGGLYEHHLQPDTIKLAVFFAHRTTLIHEEMHAGHHETCTRLQDVQLEKEHNEALDGLRNNEQTKHLEAKLASIDAFDAATPEEKQEYIENGKRAGFPDKYSRKNYKELLATLGTQMVVGRDLLTVDDSIDEESAILLREMVIERLQTALKHTNVREWLAYVTTYADIPPYVASPEMISKYHVSPLDGGVEHWNKWLEASGTLTPAVGIKSSAEEDPTEYIYDYEKDGTHTVLIRTTDPHGSLVDAAAEYLFNLPNSENYSVSAELIKREGLVEVRAVPTR